MHIAPDCSDFQKSVELDMVVQAMAQHKITFKYCHLNQWSGEFLTSVERRAILWYDANFHSTLSWLCRRPMVAGNHAMTAV